MTLGEVKYSWLLFHRCQTVKRNIVKLIKSQIWDGFLLTRSLRVAVLYHMRILYHTRMVHTICVYAYGTTIRVWYSNSYHMSIANLHGSYAYNIKQKVFALPYLLTMLDGALPSFPFREGKGLVSETGLAVSVH